MVGTPTGAWTRCTSGATRQLPWPPGFNETAERSGGGHGEGHATPVATPTSEAGRRAAHRGRLVSGIPGRAGGRPRGGPARSVSDAAAKVKDTDENRPPSPRARGRTPVRARRPARGRSRDAHDVRGHVRAAGRMERGASQGTALRAAWRARCPLPRRCGRSRQARGDAHMALKCLVSVRTNGRLCLFLMKIHKRQKG